MNDLMGKFKGLLKSPKALMVLGIGGMVIILLSSLFPRTDKDIAVNTENATYSVEEYTAELESNVGEIVSRISGDQNPTVVITLESGIRYSYADLSETDTENSSGSQNSESRQSKKQSYITVKSADGGEQALIVTEIMPEIRGVAIVCNKGDAPSVSEKIKNAVTAALNITSKRVYIAGGTSNEKR